MEVVYNFFVYMKLTLFSKTQQKEKKNQRHAIQREFESVGPTLLKSPPGAWWGLLPTLQ